MRRLAREHTKCCYRAANCNWYILLNSYRLTVILYSSKAMHCICSENKRFSSAHWHGSPLDKRSTVDIACLLMLILSRGVLTFCHLVYLRI